MSFNIPRSSFASSLSSSDFFSAIAFKSSTDAPSFGRSFGANFLITLETIVLPAKPVTSFNMESKKL